MLASRFFCVVCCVIWFERNLADGHECQLTSPSTEEKKLLERLQPLFGKRASFISNDNSTTSKYNYSLGICDNALDGAEFNDVGMFQTVIGTETRYKLGLYTKTEIRGGKNWIFLIYKGGDQYHKHCNASGVSKEREAHIMFSCDPASELNGFQLIVEKTDEFDECFYLFEINSKYACSSQPTPAPTPAPSTPSTDDTLGTGSIFCIIFFTTSGVYLIIGFLYQRIVVGAKGLEQIPNFSFWKEFGKLQADGCDFLCRCGERQEMKMYRGIDDQLLNPERREEPDDHLLPM